MLLYLLMQDWRYLDRTGVGVGVGVGGEIGDCVSLFGGFVCQVTCFGVVIVRCVFAYGYLELELDFDGGFVIYYKHIDILLPKKHTDTQ